MKLIYSLLLIVFMGTTLNAQFKLDEHGVLLGSRIDADELDFYKGYAIEGGYYFLKKVGKKNFFSLDIKLAYANMNSNIEQNNKDPYILKALNWPDTIVSLKKGTLYFNSISLILPIKYRVHFTKTSPLFWQIGFTPNLILMNASKFNYDEEIYDINKEMVLSETKDLEEKLKQQPYNIDIMVGLGYKIKQFTFDLYISRGGTRFNENNYYRGADKVTVGLNFYYNLQKTK